MTFAEYMRSQGATDEDIKILDTPIARKAFENLQSTTATALAQSKADKEASEAYNARVDTYFESETEKRKVIENEIIVARSEAARAKEALKVAQERGLINVAKDLGYEFDPPKTKDTPAPVDTSKFATTDTLMKMAELEGESIAMMSDIAAEHVWLTGQPLRNARELRREATQRKITLEQVWKEKYNVDKLRADKDAASLKERDDKIRAEERAKLTEEFASKYGNPDTRPLEPSRSFLTPRSADSARAKQPWESGFDGEGGSSDRVKRATQNALKAQYGHN